MSPNSWGWFDSSDEKSDLVRRIATDPSVVKEVAAAVRGPKKRSPRIRVMCGAHFSGASLRIAVVEDALRLIWEVGSPVATQSLGGAVDGAPIKLTCMSCGRVTASAAPTVLLGAITGLVRWKQNPAGEMPAFQWNQNNRSRW